MTALIEEAFAHHRAGRLDVAEALYRQTLAQENENLNALQLLAALTCDSGRPGEAIPLYRRAAAVLQARGNETAAHAPFYYNFGTALAAAGSGRDAVAMYRHGIALNHALPEMHAALAIELKRQGDLSGAIAAYKGALELAPDRPDWLHNLASTYAAAGEIERAIAVFRQVLNLGQARLDTLQMLGMALLAASRPQEAVVPLQRLAESLPDNPAAFSLLGKAQFGAGQRELAAASLERAVALRPEDAEAHSMIGSIRHAEKDLDAAEQAYRTALRLQPDFAPALFGLGLLLHCERDQPAAAIALFERLAAVAPEHVEVHRAFGDAWRGLLKFPEAVAAYRRYLDYLPSSPLGHLLVGESLSELGQKQDAIPYLEKALALNPERQVAHLANIDLGSALYALGLKPQAFARFREALAIEPVLTRKTAKLEPDFSALLVLAPGAYNTPYRYLIEDASYDSHILMLVPEVDYDAAMLAARCDVVVNLVSDVDQDQGMLAAAAALIDRLGRPVINHPNTIAPTSREWIAAALSGIPDCRVAKVSRHAGPELSRLAWDTHPVARSRPFLARLAGGHGGEAFEMIAAPADLDRLVADHPEADYYLIEYLNYRSADGFFRKYRFFFVGAEILPYHLSIGPEWKVHHFRTDIAAQPWMQHEEEVFLRAPETVFEPRHFAALRAIRAAIGIDFFGIDCSLDRDGNLVVFEANATMLVHGMNRDFPYKIPYVRRIKSAFAALLAATAAAP
ncbi:MAG: tetratricopeptide repeat protein [Alphaproteobacteria bacterium]|nr:tetratricopeptide repeat protein [Alphaproteobacteria bacterium]